MKVCNICIDRNSYCPVVLKLAKNAKPHESGEKHQIRICLRAPLPRKR